VEFGSFYLRVSIDCHAPYSSTARRGFVWRVAGEPGMWVVSCESRVGSQELGAWSAAPQGTFFLPGKCRFFLHGADDNVRIGFHLAYGDCGTVVGVSRRWVCI
jgi:hypothetical protein